MSYTLCMTRSRQECSDLPYHYQEWHCQTPWRIPTPICMARWRKGYLLPVYPRVKELSKSWFYHSCLLILTEINVKQLKDKWLSHNMREQKQFGCNTGHIHLFSLQEGLLDGNPSPFFPWTVCVFSFLVKLPPSQALVEALSNVNYP